MSRDSSSNIAHSRNSNRPMWKHC